MYGCESAKGENGCGGQLAVLHDPLTELEMCPDVGMPQGKESRREGTSPPVVSPRSRRWPEENKSPSGDCGSLGSTSGGGAGAGNVLGRGILCEGGEDRRVFMEKSGFLANGAKAFAANLVPIL